MQDSSLVPKTSPAQAVPPGYSLGQLAAYMLRLGTLGFGGPVALVGYMYRNLVEQRHWISEADYKEGMALSQLMQPVIVLAAAVIGLLVHPLITHS